MYLSVLFHCCMFKPYLLSLSLFLRRFILTLPFASRHSNFTNIMLLLVFISRHDIFQFTLSLHLQWEKKKFRIFFQFSQCLVCSFSEKSKQFPCDVVSTRLDPGCFAVFSVYCSGESQTHNAKHSPEMDNIEMSCGDVEYCRRN